MTDIIIAVGRLNSIASYLLESSNETRCKFGKKRRCHVFVYNSILCFLFALGLATSNCQFCNDVFLVCFRCVYDKVTVLQCCVFSLLAVWHCSTDSSAMFCV